MEISRRKTLPHEIPSWVDPQKEIYFVTINCAERSPEINSRCLMFPRDCLKPSVIGKRSFCGGRICFCSCPTICMRCFLFRLQANRCSKSSANGRNGLRRNWVSFGSVISLSIACDTMKAGVRRRITFCKILFAGSWSRVRKIGHLSISPVARSRISIGRDGALRRPPTRAGSE